MCRGKGKLKGCNSPNTLSWGHVSSWEIQGQLKNGVASLSLWSRDPRCAAGTTPAVSLHSRKALTQWLWVGLWQREEIAPQLSSHPKSATCLARPSCEAAPRSLPEQEADMACPSQGAGGQQEANLPLSRCHRPLPPREAANGAGSCRGRFVFPSPGINPWQIRGALGEQTRPGQGENTCSQPGKQLHVQGSPSPEALPPWHRTTAAR